MIALLLGCGPVGTLGWFVVVEGQIVDESGSPIAVAQVDLLAEDGTVLATVFTDPQGLWSSPIYGTEIHDNTLDLVITAEGYAEGLAHIEVDLASPDTHSLRAGPGQTFNTTPRALPAIRLASETDKARGQGTLLDATTGQPVPGISLTLQRGWNAPVGAPAEDSITTDRNGHFEVSTSIPGIYTVYAPPDGTYGGTRFPIFLSTRNTEIRATISTPLQPSRLRASLSWDDTPFDLDLHVSYPDPTDSIGRYHLWSGDPAYPPVGSGAGSDAWVELQADGGYGPETLALYTPPGDGEIRLTVLDPHHDDDPETTQLPSSHALLQVWYGDDTPRFFQINPQQVGNWWRPVEISVGRSDWYQIEQYQSEVASNQTEQF